MDEIPIRSADRLDQTGHRLLNAGRKLRAGTIVAPELRDLGQVLGILAEVVHLRARELDTQSNGGRHALKESSNDPQTGV
jgi:hypothetical protein